MSAIVFPEIIHNSQVDVRLKNVKSEYYLYMRQEESKMVFGTKAITVPMDPEVDFTVHLYTTAEQGETELALLVHQSTGCMLQMTENRTLALWIPNGVDPVVPGVFQRADSRFFYLKRTDVPNSIALEAMNGVDYRHYLASSGTSLTLKKHELQGSQANNIYPDDMMFYLDDTIINLIIEN